MLSFDNDYGRGTQQEFTECESGCQEMTSIDIRYSIFIYIDKLTDLKFCKIFLMAFHYLVINYI